MTRHPRPALEAVEPIAQEPHLTDLQVMAGNTLVVGDRRLTPQREAGLAQGRVPGATGSAEVLGRTRVVHGGRAAGRRDHRLDPLDGLGDVEVHAVHGVDGRVHQLLEPVPEVLGAFDHEVALGLEPFDRRRDVAVDVRCGRTRGASPPRSETARPIPTGRCRRCRCRLRATPTRTTDSGPRRRRRSRRRPGRTCRATTSPSPHRPRMRGSTPRRAVLVSAGDKPSTLSELVRASRRTAPRPVRHPTPHTAPAPRVAWRRADTISRTRPSSRAMRTPTSAFGTRSIRAAITSQSSADSCGIRSNTCRMDCTGLAMLRTGPQVLVGVGHRQ